MDINQSIVDESSQNVSHSLPETDSYTMILSIATCDIFKENEVSNLVDQISPLMRPPQTYYLRLKS